MLGFSHLPCRSSWDFLAELQNMDPPWMMGIHAKEKSVFSFVISAEHCQWPPGLRCLSAFWSTDTEVHDSAWGRDQLPSHCGAGKCSVYATSSATSAFPDPLSPSCIIHWILGFPVTPPRCSAVSSSILPLLVVQVPLLTLLFRLYRGVHLQITMQNTGFKSPSLTQN